MEKDESPSEEEMVWGDLVMVTVGMYCAQRRDIRNAPEGTGRCQMNRLGMCSVGEVLSLQVWEVELGFSVLTEKNQAWWCIPIILGEVEAGRCLPGLSGQPINPAGPVNSRFSERPSQKPNQTNKPTNNLGKQLMKMMRFQPLVCPRVGENLHA